MTRVAIGARCDCGFGPQDYVELAQAEKVLVNLAFMLRQHRQTCTFGAGPVQHAAAIEAQEKLFRTRLEDGE